MYIVSQDEIAVIRCLDMPEHDEKISDMVHVVIVYESNLFVRT